MKKSLLVTFLMLDFLKTSSLEEPFFKAADVNRYCPEGSYLLNSLAPLKKINPIAYLETNAKISDLLINITEDTIICLKKFIYGEEEGLKAKVANTILYLSPVGKETYPFNSILHLAMHNTSYSLITFLCEKKVIGDNLGNFKAKKNESLEALNAFNKKKKERYRHLILQNRYNEHALHFIPSLSIPSNYPSYENQIKWQDHKKYFYISIKKLLDILYAQRRYLFDTKENSWDLFINSFDRNGKTLVDKALEYQDSSLLSLYRKFEARFDDKNRLFNEIKMAIAQKKNRLLQSLLLYADDEIFSKSVDGYLDWSNNSLLHYAALQKNGVALKILLENSSLKSTVTNNDGDTFLHLLVNGLHDDILQYVLHEKNSIKRAVDSVRSYNLNIEELLSIQNNNHKTAENVLYDPSLTLSEKQLLGLQLILKQLVEGSIKVDKSFFKRNPSDSDSLLNFALQGGVFEIERILCKDNYKDQDAQGNTFMHLLIENLYKDISQFLLTSDYLLKDIITFLKRKNTLNDLLVIKNNNDETILDIIQKPLNKNTIFNTQNIDQLRNSIHLLFKRKKNTTYASRASFDNS